MPLFFISINFSYFPLVNEFLLYMNKQTPWLIKLEEEMGDFYMLFELIFMLQINVAVLLFINIAYNDLFLFAIKCWLMNEA
jgi:hypothetical protein